MKFSKLLKTSLKKQLICFLSCFYIFICIKDSEYYPIIIALISIASATFTDSLVIFLKKKQLKIAESSIITGLIVSFVLSSDTNVPHIIIASSVSIASKHLIRYKSKHIFNPAAFGIFSAVFLFNVYTGWKGAYEWFIIIPFGLYFLIKTKKSAVALSYALTSIFLIGIEERFNLSFITSGIIYSNYFFILIMLIEPKTSPNKKYIQLFFGLFVSISSFVIYKLKIPYDPVLPALLIGNITIATFSIINQHHLKLQVK